MSPSWSHPRTRGVVRLRASGGGTGGNNPARRQSNLGPASLRLGQCSRNGWQKPTGAQEEGEAWSSGGPQEAAERPPMVPCLWGRRPHLSAESVRREKGGSSGPRALLEPGCAEKVRVPRRPSLLPLPKFPLPASVVVAVGSGSKIHKPRPRLGSCQEVQGGTPEGSPSPPASAGLQDAPQ